MCSKERYGFKDTTLASSIQFVSLTMSTTTADDGILPTPACLPACLPTSRRS